MPPALLDEAFRLVSPSLLEERENATLCLEARIDYLLERFPSASRDILVEAISRAEALEAAALGLARSSRCCECSGPSLRWEDLAGICPGFSNLSYLWAINDCFLAV